jgi:UDP:flavonoid glycosyltransferase YjiC (YdhE family)
MQVLMVAFDGGGSLPPFLGLGQELHRRSHEVRCLGPQSLQGAVVRAGVAFRPLLQGAIFDPLARRPANQLREELERVFFDAGYGQDLRAEVERGRPDIIIIDGFLIGAQATAEAMDVPYTLLMHTLPGFLCQRLALPAANTVRAQANLAPVTSSEELWAHADRVLVASIQLLDNYAADGLPGLRYIGPIFESESRLEPATLADVLQPGEPLVVVSFSTTYMDQERTLGRVIEALRHLPLQGLVTAGPAVELASLPVVGNVTVRRWLPHATVLPQAALVITHAGHGTVARALSHGVPLLCLPFGRDQSFIAERVQALGAGLVASPDASAPALTTAITALLHDGSYRRAAQDVAVAMRAVGPGAANAATELEASVAPR